MLPEALRIHISVFSRLRNNRWRIAFNRGRIHLGRRCNNIFLATIRAKMQAHGMRIGIGIVIGKTSRHLILALASLSLTGMAGRLAAQHSPAAGSLTIERIAEERERDIALPTNLAWSPTGKILSFIRRAPRVGKAADRSPATEVWGMDTTTGGAKNRD